MILCDENKSSIDTLYRIASTIIHQSSHQWFGNVVSPTWWTHIWINGGLAEYFKYYITNKVEIDKNLCNNFYITSEVGIYILCIYVQR